MNKLTQIIFIIAIQLTSAQNKSNDSIKLDYEKNYAFGLDGNPRAALALLEANASKKITAKDVKFINDFENRFKFDEDKSDFLEKRKSKMDLLLKIYRDYWRLSFFDKDKNNDSLIMKNVHKFLKENYAPAKNLILNEDSLDVYQTKYIKSLGYQTTGFGTTGGLYDLLVWKTEKNSIHKIKYDGKKTIVKVIAMDDFMTLGWEEYATLGRYYPGGWAKPEGLYYVKRAYDEKSEHFLISYINHEGRHFADYKLFPNLKGIGSADLEYRAKLTELSLLTKKTLFSTIEFFINGANYDSDNGHSIANFCVIRDLSKVLFKNNFEKDLSKWKTLSVKQINTAANIILKNNTNALKKIPNVEKYIKN